MREEPNRYVPCNSMRLDEAQQYAILLKSEVAKAQPKEAEMMKTC